LQGPSASVSQGLRPAWEREGTVYVLAVDGLSSDVVGLLSAEQQLPNLARLASEGCSGPLQTASPTNSSLLWTSVATGCHYRDHGIDGFRHYRLLGVNLTRNTLRRAKKYGLKQLVRRLERAGLLTHYLLDGRHMKKKPFWDILSDAGAPVGVVNWWHTWPAHPINGFVISDWLFHWRALATIHVDRPATGLAFPDSLQEEASKLSVRPDEVPIEEIRRFVNLTKEEVEGFFGDAFTRHELRSELRYLIALDLSCWRAFEHCLREFPRLTVAALYLRGADVAQHAAFQYAPWARETEVAEEDRRRFAQAVPEAYRAADRRVGKVLSRMEKQDALLVVSDHGFAFQRKRGKYGHARGRPPGIFYALGSEFARGRRVSGATIYDFAPTLLRICGLPPARDMHGEALEEILTPEFRREHPPLEPIGSYGPPQRRLAAPAPPRDVEEKIKEHLRGLGYFD